MAPSKLRKNLKSSVNKALEEKKQHRSDQAQVWKDVAALDFCFGVDSHTNSLEDIALAVNGEIQKVVENVPYVQGANGLAVATTNGVFLDLFDKPSTCEAVWSRLISAAAMDVLHNDHAVEINQDRIQGIIEHAVQSSWSQVEPVGTGDEYRLAEEDIIGSSLYVEDTPVHISLVCS